MRLLSLTLPAALVLVFSAGCAQMGGGSTSAMGASPSKMTAMCRDGAWVASASECSNHGGTERVIASPSR